VIPPGSPLKREGTEWEEGEEKNRGGDGLASWL